MATLRILTEQCSRGIGFRVFGNALDALLALGVGIIVARIVSPEEYGLFGLALSLTLIIERLGAFGMLPALIQRYPLTPAHEAAGVIVQAGSAVLLSGLLFVGAPVIEALMHMPGLAPILRWQACVLIAHGLALLPESRLHRQLAFDRLSAIQVGEKLIGGGVTVGLVLHGHGVMALVYGTLTGALMRLMCLWVCVPQGVPLVWQSAAFRDLFGYGFWSILIGLATSFSLRMDVLIAGRQIGSEAVGLYHRAAHLATFPLNFLMQPINKVLFPALASVQGQQERLRRGYLSSARFAALVAFPLMVGLWGTADVLVPLVYGPQWHGSVPILQVLSIAGIFRVILTIDGVVIQAQGHMRAQAVRHAAWLVLITVFGMLGSYGGILGIAAGFSVATGVFLVSLTILALRVTQVQFVELLTAIRAGTLASAAMGLSMWGVQRVVGEALPSLSLLLALVCIGCMVYVAAMRLWLTPEDRRLLETVCRSLPARVSALVYVLLGSPVKIKDVPS
jgi:O-antigen/teichoic acid export membrane protein